jgi:hypothetical protein
VLVLPQIATDCDHIHRTVYGDIEAPIERLTKLTAPRTRVIERQSDERTIEMNVREMKDLDWDAHKALNAEGYLVSTTPINHAGEHRLVDTKESEKHHVFLDFQLLARCIWAAEAGASIFCRGCEIVWSAQTIRCQLAGVADTERRGRRSDQDCWRLLPQAWPAAGHRQLRITRNGRAGN